MEAFRIFPKKERLDWDHDAEADVLYISLGEPQPGLGVDIGEGVVVRYDSHSSEVVGLTVVGLREKLQRALSAETR